MRRVKRCARYVIRIASAIVTMMVSATLAPYLIQRCFCVSGWSFSSGMKKCGARTAAKWLFPSARFEDLDGQKNENRCGREEEYDVAGIDHAFAEVAVTGRHALIDELPHESRKACLASRPPGDDRDHNQNRHRRDGRDDLAPGERRAEQSDCD